MVMRAIIATDELIDGDQRKLAWFARNRRGVYFELGGSFVASHTSYHVDGKVFRTSPATGHRAKFQRSYVPLDEFRGWTRLGFAMINKDQLARNAPVKPKDRKAGSILATVPIAQMPSETINLFMELLHRDRRHWLKTPGIQPPECTVLLCLELDDLLVVITVFGHESNLLVRPTEEGFQVRHYNDRYSANQPGATYNFEAYR